MWHWRGHCQRKREIGYHGLASGAHVRQGRALAKGVLQGEAMLLRALYYGQQAGIRARREMSSLEQSANFIVRRHGVP